MRIVLFFILIMLCFNWNTAKAQGLDAFHTKIQQNWAFPDCGKYKEALIFTRHFIIQTSKTEMALGAYTLQKGGKDYSILAQKNSQTPIQILADGVLRMAMTDKTDNPLPAKWDDMQIENEAEYTACDKAPTIIPKAMQRLIRYVDRIYTKCTLSFNNDCGRVLFKLSDANDDKKISPLEIRKAFTSFLLFAELSVNPKIDEKMMKDIATRAKEESAPLADQMISMYDANGSDDLDYNEVMTDFKAPENPIILEILKKSGKTIPTFEFVAATLD